jgi:arylsulfatase A-like enzyme
VQQPLHVVDLYPTILTLAGASLEQRLPLDGRDAWATIAEGKPSPHDEILLNTTPRNGAIRVGDWKLVLNGHRGVDDTEAVPGEQVAVELFNLACDLSEKNNLASGQPDKVKELRERYDALARQAVKPKQAPKAADFKSPRVWGEKE